MRNWQTIQTTKYDLIVIGGGVNGAAVARDAAWRGLKTILIEKGDFACGTSSWSTRLIHGGLRYLEYFEFPLVRESLHEREVLLQTAPHLVKPLLLTIPIYKGRSRPYWKIWAGMILYDLFSYDKTLPIHRMLPKQKFLKLFPHLDPEGISGGAQYYDAQGALAERICLENILSAREAQATTLNYVEASQINIEEKRIVSVTCKDVLTGEEFTVQGSNKAIVINTSGPWVDQVCQLGVKENNPAPIGKTRKIGGTKGSHIFVDHFTGAPTSTLYVEAKSDGRPFFIVPWLGMYLIGTTDIPYGGKKLYPLKADNDEVDYLLRETNYIIPTANLSRDSVKFTYAGVRPLPNQEGKKAGSITRKHILYDHSKEGITNLISLIGGKLTTHRHVGEEIVDKVYKKIKLSPPPCPTRKQKLPGYILPTDARIQKAVEQYKNYISLESIEHLFSIYGARAIELLTLIDQEPELAEKIAPQLPNIKAEIVYSVQAEFAHTLIDIGRRRTTIAMRGNYGLHLLPVITDVLQKYCGWSQEKCAQQTHDYQEYMEKNCIPDFSSYQPLALA